MTNFDDAIEQAWAQHRRGLADRLAALGQGDAVGVALADPAADDDEGAAPYCQALAWADDRLMVEAVGDRHLAADRALSPQQVGRLRELGFEDPSDAHAGNFSLDLEQRDADRAAWVMVDVMRTVFGALHPVYLRAEADAADPVDAGPVDQDPHDKDFPPHDAGPWFPRGDDEVRGAVTRVARRLLGAEPAWDEDGDLPLVTDRSVLHVVVAADVPRLLLSATLLTDVVDEARALVELNLLNRRHFGLTFALLEGRVVVRRELAVSAFVPGEVMAELSRLTDHLDGWVVDLRARLGGRALDEGAPTPHRAGGGAAGGGAQQERYRAAFAVMKELLADDRDSLDPATLVRVFHGDRALLMLAIGHCRTREAHWRGRAKELLADGKGRSARVARARALHHRELRSRLRRALRIIVRARVSDVPEQLTLFDQEGAS